MKQMAGTSKAVKLYYFDVYARGEPIRMLLHDAHLDFEDVRFSMPGFKDLKLQRPDLMEFGQVPVLEAPFLPGGQTGYFAQSQSISRLLGKLNKNT